MLAISSTRKSTHYSSPEGKGRTEGAPARNVLEIRDVGNGSGTSSWYLNSGGGGTALEAFRFPPKRPPNKHTGAEVPPRLRSPTGNCARSAGAPDVLDTAFPKKTDELIHKLQSRWIFPSPAAGPWSRADDFRKLPRTPGPGPTLQGACLTWSAIALFVPGSATVSVAAIFRSSWDVSNGHSSYCTVLYWHLSQRRKLSFSATQYKTSSWLIILIRKKVWCSVLRFGKVGDYFMVGPSTFWHSLSVSSWVSGRYWWL